MSDSQRPIPPVVRHAQGPSFEVPDLEVEAVKGSQRRAAPARAAATQALGAKDHSFGVSFDFGEELEEIERSAQPSYQLALEHAPRAIRAKPSVSTSTEATPSWPSGRAAVAAELEFDPLELANLAGYGTPPDSAPLTLAYAYRVFTRQRELKRQLVPIALECERAQLEREATLAEFSRALRSALESSSESRRLLAPLLQVEQRASARGQALTAFNAKLAAELGQFDSELAQLQAQAQVEEGLERAAERQCKDRKADAERAEAKWKRVGIEMRALTHVTERELGTQDEPSPEAEAAEFPSLRQRAQALEPEVTRTRAELEQAERALAQVHARQAALRQRYPQVSRQKQAASGALQSELSARAESVSEAELEQRGALVDLARTVLASPGTIDVPEVWLERVREIGTRADQSIVRAEMLRRAIASYDAPCARQGVRLACTASALLLVLFVFKLIF